MLQLSLTSLLYTGVDFFSRAIKLNEQIISLQLWDTAGQERLVIINISQFIVNRCTVLCCYSDFCTMNWLSSLPPLSFSLSPFLSLSLYRFQSVTRAYYRGAQGVILMYDITNEDSFIAVKTWINSIQVNLILYS